MTETVLGRLGDVAVNVYWPGVASCDYDLVDGAVIGCFPDLHEALAGAGVDQVITL